MKKFILFARVGLIFTLIIFQPAVGAHVSSPTPEYSNYVVIGAFAVEKNAARFTRLANASNHHAKFDLNPNRNLYYVFVLSTGNRSEAIAEALRLRKETKYDDAWVYNGAIGKNSEDKSAGTDINPESEKVLETIAPQEITAPVIEEVTQDSVVTPPSTSINITERTEAPQLTSTALTGEEIAGKNFVFDLFRAVDRKPVAGDVDVVDTEKSRKMATYKGNTPVKVSAPQTKSGNVSFVCESFGYRKMQTEFSFKSADAQNLSVDQGGNIVIPFELIRLAKGDIAVMYNVFFFKDAAIMRPESRFEVNSLLEMLKENPMRKIRVHGHTNGNASGKIITRGENGNFFSLTDSRDGFGTAKKLSESRASAIKEYLESNGIEESRIEIKAWGGKKPIHDKHATRAQENVRVEVEILSD